MTRSQLFPMPEYFDRYINKCDDVEILQAIETSISELDLIPLDKWKAIGNKVYAPGKWTIKDVLQHLLDTEKVFMYRAVAFARGEKGQPLSFSEDGYAAAANANARALDEMIDELRLSHQLLKQLYASFTKDMLHIQGKGFKGMHSVASIGFILPGHQRWHFRILEEKYYPLL